MPVPEEFGTYENLLRLAAPVVFDGYVARLRAAFGALERAALAMKSEPRSVPKLLPAFVGVMNEALPRTADEEALMEVATPCVYAYWRDRGDRPGSSWKYLVLASRGVDDLPALLGIDGVADVALTPCCARYEVRWPREACGPQLDSGSESESALELESEPESASDSEPELDP
jgi:hypothetical protein